MNLSKVVSFKQSCFIDRITLIWVRRLPKHFITLLHAWNFFTNFQVVYWKRLSDVSCDRNLFVLTFRPGQIWIELIRCICQQLFCLNRTDILYDADQLFGLGLCCKQEQSPLRPQNQQGPAGYTTSQALMHCCLYSKRLVVTSLRYQAWDTREW